METKKHKKLIAGITACLLLCTSVLLPSAALGEEEQAQLRRDYIDSVKANLKSQLNTLYVLDEKTGKKTKIVDFERERAARAGKKKENR